MRKLLTDFLDLIFPPSDNRIILSRFDIKNYYNLYEPGKYLHTEYLSHYPEPVIRAAITENKFYRHPPATKLLAHLLESWGSKQSGSILFIPIPLGKERLRERGFNQVEIILNKAGLSLSTNTTLLKRTIETKPQSHLHKKERLQNIKNAFTFIGESADLSEYAQIILIDDVVTTGATLAAARATLLPHLPPRTTLRCLAIAH